MKKKEKERLRADRKTNAKTGEMIRKDGWMYKQK
jgi:hypothetical protein